MRDARVREHPLDVRLDERGEVPPGERDAGDHGERDRPELRLLGERDVVSRRMRQDEAATFVAAAMKAVTGVGAPS